MYHKEKSHCHSPWSHTKFMHLILLFLLFISYIQFNWDNGQTFDGRTRRYVESLATHSKAPYKILINHMSILSKSRPEIHPVSIHLMSKLPNYFPWAPYNDQLSSVPMNLLFHSPDFENCGCQSNCQCTHSLREFFVSCILLLQLLKFI